MESPSLWDVAVGRTHLVLLPICLLGKRCLLEAEGMAEPAAGTPGKPEPWGRAWWPVSLRVVSGCPPGPEQGRVWTQ